MEFVSIGFLWKKNVPDYNSSCLSDSGFVHGRWCGLTNIFGYLVQMDPKFLRNQRYAKKHNRVAGVEEEEEET